MSKAKYPSIFSPQLATIVFIFLQIFFKARSFENWGVFSDIPQFKLGSIRSRDALRSIARERKDLMDYNFGCTPVLAEACCISVILKVTKLIRAMKRTYVDSKDKIVQ